MKKVILITGTENTRITLHEQLKAYIGDLFQFESYSIDKGLNKKITADLIVISTHLILEDIKSYIDENSKIIIAKRILNYNLIEQLLFIPEGIKVLLVNDCKETTFDCIDWLKKIGLNHLEYIPFYPGCELNERVDYAITPGEIEIVPKGIKNIIDIGPRLIDIVTIAEILKELNLYDERWEKITLMYFEKIINLAKNIAKISLERTKAFEHIKMILDAMKDGIITFDEKGKIIFSNENFKFLFGKNCNIIGINLKEIFSNSELISFLLNNEKDISKIIEFREGRYLVSKFILENEQITIAIFKNLKKIEEIEKQKIKELYKKGYYAKYTFDDIIGENESFKYIKEISKKMSRSDLTVLIEGESGTGKELFASAIHNASGRRNNPFVAINLSALPESLAESELFGYEEGAFTGALKDGKKGLFEQANGGTIFLDEIGDASIKLQTKLLRVLEEKEIMRIGGNKIIPIDVRVIAATNKNLEDLVERGEFRKDLYYRLKVMYIKIPPLRERKDDIKTLFNYFISKKNLNLKVREGFWDFLLDYDWQGNIRELKNMVEYISAIYDGNEINEYDLIKNFFSKKINMNNMNNELKIILKIMRDLSSKGITVSRRKIMNKCKDIGIDLTEQKVRRLLKELEKMGYVKPQKGRGGTLIKRQLDLYNP